MLYERRVFFDSPFSLCISLLVLYYLSVENRQERWLVRAEKEHIREFY